MLEILLCLKIEGPLVFLPSSPYLNDYTIYLKGLRNKKEPTLL